MLRFPIVVYVYPGGAQAASAGVLLTIAGDIAAMAPGTNIGAAHPVTGSGGDVPKTMNEKVVNDMLAFGRSIARERGRNAEWVEEAIRESVFHHRRRGLCRQCDRSGGRGSE